MQIHTTRQIFTALAGISLLGTVGCAAESAQSAAPAPATTSATGASTGASTGSAPAAAGAYSDGTFSADGHYQSPNGRETIGITLTLKDSVVTAVEAQSHPSNPNTKIFQGRFVSGIAEAVVGRNIDDLEVGTVAGSSLTPEGFNDALEQIKSDARA